MTSHDVYDQQQETIIRYRTMGELEQDNAELRQQARRLAAERDRLRAVVRELVIDRVTRRPGYVEYLIAGSCYDGMACYCLYCSGSVSDARDAEEADWHDDNCPIMRGRQLIPGDPAGEETDDR